MRGHIPVVAWVHIVLNSLSLLLFGGAALALIGIGGLAASSAGRDAALIFGVFGSLATFMVFLAGILALPGLIGGIGLLLRAGWGRMLIIIVSLFGLLNFPLGTVIGIYSLVVMFNDEVIREFA